MEFIKRAWPAIIAALALFTLSCAHEETEEYEDKELRSFERWMQMYVPDAVKLDNGMYYEWITRAPDGAEAPLWGDYVEIDYRGKLLSDYVPETGKASIFMTRYEEDAKLLGTFTYYTRYVPQMIIYSRNNYLMEGMQEALELMKVGDNIRLFLPSSQAATTAMLTMDYGYGGNATMPASVPVIVELELTGIIEQPQTREEKFVNEFAAREWNQSLKDTIREYIYVNMIDFPISADTVKTDSTATIYYAAFFGFDYEDPDTRFLIETNIESVAKEYFRDVSTSSAVSYTPSSPPSSPDAAALEVLTQVFETETIPYGSKFEIMTTSSYAYGASGQAAASGVTEVQGYQPIYFYVEVEDYVEDEDD
ncbi:MAG: hypothetical protein LUF87_09895 [Alistipes sp.]|nr:hypothetical protein [Alistipes sp.]